MVQRLWVVVDRGCIRICCFLACGFELLEGFGDDAFPVLELERVDVVVAEARPASRLARAFLDWQGWFLVGLLWLLDAVVC